MPTVPILMKNCVRSVALLCMLLGGNNVFGEIKDVHGWKKAQWGMTEDEVLNVFQGEASRIKPARKVKGLTEKPDAFATIEIKTLHILDDKYGAVFIFDENTKKLIKIMLHATSSMASESQFNVLEKSLKEKYVVRRNTPSNRQYVPNPDSGKIPHSHPERNDGKSRPHQSEHPTKWISDQLGA